MHIETIRTEIEDLLSDLKGCGFSWSPEEERYEEVSYLLKRKNSYIIDYADLLSNLKIKENEDIIYDMLKARVYIHIMFLTSYQFTTEELKAINLIDKELLDRQLYYMNYTNLQDILPQGEFAQFYYWLEDRREYEEDLGCWDSLKNPLSEEEIEARWSNKLTIDKILKNLKENFNYKIDAIDKYAQAPLTILNNNYTSERISEEFTDRHHIHQLLMNDFPYKYDDLEIISATDNLILDKASELNALVEERDSVRINCFINWLQEALVREQKIGFWHYSNDTLLRMIRVKWSLAKAKKYDLELLNKKKYEMSQIVSWYTEILNIPTEISDSSLFKVQTGRRFINEIIFIKQEWMSNSDLTITYMIDKELLANYEKYSSWLNESQTSKFSNFLNWLKGAVEEEKTIGYWQEEDVPNNILYAE